MIATAQRLTYLRPWTRAEAPLGGCAYRLDTIGILELPDTTHPEEAERAIRRRYPQANRFTLRDDGTPHWWFAGNC